MIVWFFYLKESYAWKKIKQAGPVWPAALTATTLTAVDDQNALYLICGYSSRLGYSSRVYSYNVGTTSIFRFQRKKKIIDK